MPTNYYLTLGLASDAGPEEIKNAYRRLVKEFHPDRYGANGAPFLNIQKAYSVLSDPVKKNRMIILLKNRRKIGGLSQKLNEDKERPRLSPLFQTEEPLK